MKLSKTQNRAFQKQIVQALNIIISIESGLDRLRSKLRINSDKLFERLMNVWVVDPVSTIVLALTAQHYSLATEIIKILSVSEIDLNMLVQLSQIVRLLDLPHYSYLRMQLLYPDKFPALVDTLLGLLLVIPQGETFDSLYTRLDCAGAFQRDLYMPKEEEISPENSALLKLLLDKNKEILPRSFPH